MSTFLYVHGQINYERMHPHSPTTEHYLSPLSSTSPLWLYLSSLLLSPSPSLPPFLSRSLPTLSLLPSLSVSLSLPLPPITRSRSFTLPSLPSLVYFSHSLNPLVLSDYPATLSFSLPTLSLIFPPPTPSLSLCPPTLFLSLSLPLTQYHPDLSHSFSHSLAHFPALLPVLSLSLCPPSPLSSTSPVWLTFSHNPPTLFLSLSLPLTQYHPDLSRSFSHSLSLSVPSISLSLPLPFSLPSLPPSHLSLPPISLKLSLSPPSHSPSLPSFSLCVPHGKRVNRTLITRDPSFDCRVESEAPRSTTKAPQD